MCQVVYHLIQSGGRNGACLDTGAPTSLILSKQTQAYIIYKGTKTDQMKI